MKVGTEWLVEAEGCRPEALRDGDVLRRLCDEVLAALGLRVVERPLWHQFPPPGGVTGLYLLAESHLACHTYPEHGVATFNLCSCRERGEWPWEDRLQQALGAARVTVRALARGESEPPRGARTDARRAARGAAAR